MDFIKLKNHIYEVKSLTEWWEVRIYDYDDKKDYHEISAESSESADYLLYEAYEKYDNKEKILLYLPIDVENIITNKQSHLTLKPIKGAYNQKTAFIQANSDFTEHDLDLIMRYKEQKQRDSHHQSNLEAQYAAAVATRHAGATVAGLPIDWR